MSRIDALEAMLARGTDSALLRFSLGNEYLAADSPGAAATHLRVAVKQDPGYSAAWKLLGRALAQCEGPAAAADAWRAGIAAAQRSGDVQAAKEMRVFLRRAERDSR